MENKLKIHNNALRATDIGADVFRIIIFLATDEIGSSSSSRD